MVPASSPVVVPTPPVPKVWVTIQPPTETDPPAVPYVAPVVLWKDAVARSVTWVPLPLAAGDVEWIIPTKPVLTVACPLRVWNRVPLVPNAGSEHGPLPMGSVR